MWAWFTCLRMFISLSNILNFELPACDKSCGRIKKYRRIDCSCYMGFSNKCISPLVCEPPLLPIVFVSRCEWLHKQFQNFLDPMSFQIHKFSEWNKKKENINAFVANCQWLSLWLGLCKPNTFTLTLMHGRIWGDQKKTCQISSF